MKNINKTLYICRPYFQHLFQNFPTDLIHQIHKWTAGIILVDHIEPDGSVASLSHKPYIITRIF